ncbi:MAG TPA: MFS transporter [Ktedonobacterales bacterium]|nr:MFS transporter [Ktedonobacterales bacterium]
MNAHDVGDDAALAPEHAAALTVRQQLALSILWLAINFQSSALFPIVIPVQILLFITPTLAGSAQQAAFLGALSAVTAVIALVVPPVAGALSDRTTGQLGRRRPYVVVGTLLLILGASVLASPRTVMFLLAGLLVFQLGNSICTAGYQGLLPDLVPETQRGEASGYMGLMTILGNVGSLGVASLLLKDVSNGVGASADAIHVGAAVFYALSGVVLLICGAITILGVHETPLPPRVGGADRGHTLRDLWRRFADAWLAPWRHRDFTWVFLTRCSVMLGLTLFITFIAYYFANVEHMTNFVGETAILALLALLGAVVSAFGLGLLSDRIGRVTVVCVATLCMAAPALAFMVLPQGAPLWPLGIVFGLGYGAYTSVDWALAVDVLPSSQAVGKDMGLWSIASTLPAILAPAIGGVVIAIAGNFGQTALGYRAVFLLAGIFLLAGAVFVLAVRDRASLRARHA